MSTVLKWKALLTEAINPGRLSMDHVTAEEVINLMVAEDRKVRKVVYRERAKIAMASDLIATGFRKRGRLVFIGAGTSSRFDALEAAERL